jgi:hypothetical protein
MGDTERHEGTMGCWEFGMNRQEPEFFPRVSIFATGRSLQNQRGLVSIATATALRNVDGLRLATNMKKGIYRRRRQRRQKKKNDDKRGTFHEIKLSLRGSPVKPTVFHWS